MLIGAATGWANKAFGAAVAAVMREETVLRTV